MSQNLDNLKGVDRTAPVSHVPHQRRRKRFLIDRRFQLRYTLLLCLASGMIFLSYTSLLLYFHQVNAENLINEALIQIPSVVEQLRSDQEILKWIIIVGFLFTVLIVFAVGIFLTHRVSGPIENLKCRLEEVISGKTQVRMRLRKHDEFRSLEILFNEAMQAIEKRNSKT